jgi:hypothetical protein
LIAQLGFFGLILYGVYRFAVQVLPIAAHAALSAGHVLCVLVEGKLL